MITMKAGAQGFRWFFGVVEDRDDPLKVGRLRVRIFNVHPQDKSALPTDDLHWAFVVMPPNSAGHQQVGTSPTGIMVDSVVFGFFADGDERQIPIVLGSLAGIPDLDISKHDVSKLARGINEIDNKKKRIGPEPSSPYKSKYPFNKVIQTERGHAIEIDDTKGAERIHVYHRSGTYSEIDAQGNRVDKIVKDHYHIVAGKEEVYIEGNVNIVVNGNVNMSVPQGNVDVSVGGTYTVTSGGTMTFKAPKIDLNP